MTFTTEQQKAIDARGNTLVLAGAGSGKTRTLVERCARLLLDSTRHISARNILVVTFNEAAAAEVRERLRLRLECENTERAFQQLALLDSAPISTLHSFCFTLLREHFFELELDPAVTILEETQARVLFLRTFDELLTEHFAGRHPFSAELREFIRTHLRGWPKPLLDFVSKVHEFTQTRPDPEGWFRRQFAMLDQTDCAQWQVWLNEAIEQWRAWWLPWLRHLPAENTNAHACADLLEQGGANVVEQVLARDRKECWPDKSKSRHRRPIEKMFEQAEFLRSLQDSSALQQDWEWSRKPLRLLLRLAQQFGERFNAAKQERCVLDFHDLEQGAVRLLWRDGKTTPIADLWRKRFAAVFVDEYQDINAVQDQIIRALSRDNRFLVGDNKQSIYRFRQADPAIFQRYLELAQASSTGEPAPVKGAEGQTNPAQGADNAAGAWTTACLSENFRSHEGVLNFLNPLFSWAMRREIGGVQYDERAALRFGEAPERAHLRSSDGEPVVELHVRFSDAPGSEEDDEEIEDIEREARLVAWRLRELRRAGFEIEGRPVEWRDMVVLLRSVSGKLESYCKAFEALGVPLQTRQNSFYTTQEVFDLCNLLHILDNPLQDIPLVAVLRSPLCGLNANELGNIRIVSEARSFWQALKEFHECKKDLPGREKVDLFLTRYHAWRRERSCASLSQRLERILADTGYDEWLLSQPRGRQRYANVQQLLRIARQFDETRGESLYLFLRHIEELQEAVGDIEPAVATHENAVRLMTVHQSKGLEFPVVAAPDLGKPFNRIDEMQALLIDEKHGICAMIKPPDAGQRYPSLPLWRARLQQRIEMLGEELRLMYVAFTRAQNRLLLFGTVREKNAERAWAIGAPTPLPHHIARAHCWLDWIGEWLDSISPGWWTRDQGTTAHCQYRIHRATIPAEATGAADPALDFDLAAIEERLNFVYPHSGATREAAKTSVTTLRRRQENDDEANAPFRYRGKRDGRTRGLACHKLLEHLNLAAKLDLPGIREQAERILTFDEIELVDLEGIAEFWNSPHGRDILAVKDSIRRELEFTCRLTAKDAREWVTIPEGEFVVLQGIVDLAIIRPSEIHLIDFKTDDARANEVQRLVDAYRPQLALYALALQSIYSRPVTRKALYFVQPRQLVEL